MAANYSERIIVQAIDSQGDLFHLFIMASTLPIETQPMWSNAKIAGINMSKIVCTGNNAHPEFGVSLSQHTCRLCPVPSVLF